MKIKKIEVKNFKAIGETIADFGGCSAIITAGNNKGKTSLLRGLTDRLRGEKPEIILKEGTEKGFTTMELTDGSKIKWSFTGKTESFSYTTVEGFVIKTGVLKTIGERYFGLKFDIDKFLMSTPKAQVVTLQKLVGLDFEEVNDRFNRAYSDRTEKNRVLKGLKENSLTPPEEIAKPNIEILKAELKAVREKNDLLSSEYQKENKTHLDRLLKFNAEQRRKALFEKETRYILNKMQGETRGDLIQFIKFDEFTKYVDELPKAEDEMIIKNLQAPQLENLTELEAKIDTAYQNLTYYNNYVRDLTAYESWVSVGKLAKIAVENADKLVKDIEQEKKDMINSANIPPEFEFGDDGILYKGLPLSNNQMSSSSKYIASLKLGAMALGEVKAMHFDASFLDRENLEKVQAWADENDLQLLIERPDFDGGEIEYQII